MTERGNKSVLRTRDQFTVGPSSMKWDNGKLIIEIQEICVPLPFSLRGRVILTPHNSYDAAIQLDDEGKHFWQAVAPHGTVSVEFDKPSCNWSGPAYHDMNWGVEPLEQGFKNWTWLRTNTDLGTQVLYNLERRDGSHFAFGRCYNGGKVEITPTPKLHALSRGFWGMTRNVASEEKPKLLSTLEDAPFYTRNHVGITLNGNAHEAYHESLSLDRFTSPIVQAMLPFRMPRRA
jgi:carotenoid 1,2-hydratase